MPDHPLPTLLAALLASLVASAAPAAGQTANAPPPRLPETGVAIIDCAPSPPAPEASCVLRVPPLSRRVDLRSHPLGDAEGEKPSFEFVRGGDALFPEGLTHSATVVLVDLTPGPQRGRAATFAAEKALIRDLVAALPDDELVAIYGFNEELRPIAEFSTDRAAQLAAVDDLALEGVNTRLATQAERAIDILGRRDDVLLKNLIVVSDGDEEGIDSLDEVSAAAEREGVVISALGMFWRRLGVRETARGMDYLERLTEGSRGALVPVQLRRARGEGETAVSEFAAGFANARRQSGLILPAGAARPGILTVSLVERSIGAGDGEAPRDLSVTFAPQGTTEPADVIAPPPEPPEPEGLPLLVLSLVGGTALAGALGVALFVQNRRRAQAGAAADEVAEAPSPEAAEEAGATRLVGADALAKPIGFLVREDTGERIPIRGARTAVGRGRSNAVVLANDSISRVHAELHRNRDGGFSVTDMDSLNGTFVNEARVVGTRRVERGDVIRFGDVRMRLLRP